MLLDFLKLVTDGWSLESVTLSAFRNARISSGHAIIFAEACDRRAVP